MLNQGSDFRAYRNGVKFSLLKKRSPILSEGYYRAECAVCGLPIMDNADMHEALISRRSWIPAELMYTEENCVLVHPGGKTGGCHKIAHEEYGYERCVEHLVKYVGVDRMINYLSKVSSLTKNGFHEPLGRLLIALVRLGYDRNDLLKKALDLDNTYGTGENS